MRDILSISIDRKLKLKLEKYAKKRNVKRSVLVREALNKHLIVEELRDLRSSLRPEAEREGIFSEEDLFKLLS